MGLCLVGGKQSKDPVNWTEGSQQLLYNRVQRLDDTGKEEGKSGKMGCT